MEIYEVLKQEIDKKGVTQTWIVNQMNSLDISLNMTCAKMSAVLAGKRKLAGEEFIAICRVLELDTDVFIKQRDAS